METTETETETISNLKKKIIANHTDINNVMQMVDEIEDLARSDQAGKEQAEYPQIEKNTLQTVIDSLEEDLSNLRKHFDKLKELVEAIEKIEAG